LKWKTCSRFDQLVWREWEGEYFVYDPGGGQTHVLNEASALILRLTTGGAMDEEELEGHLLARAEPGVRELVDAHLINHLAHLADLCLLVPEGRIDI
jgi:PqqD family protein of HPr-rel-A system